MHRRPNGPFAFVNTAQVNPGGGRTGSFFSRGSRRGPLPPGTREGHKDPVDGMRRALGSVGGTGRRRDVPRDHEDARGCLPITPSKKRRKGLHDALRKARDMVVRILSIRPLVDARKDRTRCSCSREQGERSPPMMKAVPNDGCVAQIGVPMHTRGSNSISMNFPHRVPVRKPHVSKSSPSGMWDSCLASWCRIVPFLMHYSHGNTNTR